MERRTFLSRIVSFFAAVTAALMALPAFRFLIAALSGREESGWYTIGSTDSGQMSEEINQVTYNRILREGWLTRAVQETVWVRRKPDGTFVVFEPHCTHLGCAFAWNTENHRFECPCHGGKFDLDGNRIEGPPPRPLDRYEVRQDGNILRIGKVLKG